MDKPKGFENDFDYDEYRAYINSKAWDDLRNKRLKMDQFECQLCGNRNNVQVHHLVYPIHKNYGTEPLSDLITLCADCHKSIDKLRKGQEVNPLRFYRHPHRLEVWVRVNNKAETAELKIDYGTAGKPIILCIYTKEEKEVAEYFGSISYSDIYELRERYGENNVMLKVR